ncbi:hypothetical protein D3C81_2133070 [compost metagenome]
MAQEQTCFADVCDFRRGFWPDIPKLKTADSCSYQSVAHFDRFVLGLFPRFVPAIAEHFCSHALSARTHNKIARKVLSVALSDFRDQRA